MSIRYERAILVDVERELRADLLASLAPGLGMLPELLAKMEDTCTDILMPWTTEGESASVDYDQLYYDNIGRFEDDKE